PALQESFPDVSPAGLSWVLNAYSIVAAATLVPAGVLADRYGAKRIVLLGTSLFTLSSAACALAPGAGALVGARVVQAGAASLMTPAGVALVLAAVPPTRRATAMATWGVVGSVAAAAGPSLGALLVEVGGWRWAFW